MLHGWWELEPCRLLVDRLGRRTLWFIEAKIAVGHGLRLYSQSINQIINTSSLPLCCNTCSSSECLGTAERASLLPLATIIAPSSFESSSILSCPLFLRAPLTLAVDVVDGVVGIAAALLRTVRGLFNGPGFIALVSSLLPGLITVFCLPG